MLVHDVDPAIASVTRIAESNFLPVQRKRAGGGLQIPGEYRGEGTLAGAVLAQERVDLAASNRQRRFVESDDITEALGNTTNFDLQTQNSSLGTTSSPFMISANFFVR